MSTFELPEFITTTGSKTYIAGEDGQPMGEGYHSYEVLFGTGADGQEHSVLVGVLGAMKVILSNRTYQPLVGGPDGQTYWGYTIVNGTLNGYRYENELTPLGSWPPDEVPVPEHE